MQLPSMQLTSTRLHFLPFPSKQEPLVVQVNPKRGHINNYLESSLDRDTNWEGIWDDSQENIVKIILERRSETWVQVGNVPSPSIIYTYEQQHRNSPLVYPILSLFCEGHQLVRGERKFKRRLEEIDSGIPTWQLSTGWTSRRLIKGTQNEWTNVGVVFAKTIKGRRP